MKRYESVFENCGCDGDESKFVQANNRSKVRAERYNDAERKPRSMRRNFTRNEAPSEPEPRTVAEDNFSDDPEVVAENEMALFSGAAGGGEAAVVGDGGALNNMEYEDEYEESTHTNPEPVKKAYGNGTGQLGHPDMVEGGSSDVGFLSHPAMIEATKEAANNPKESIKESWSKSTRTKENASAWGKYRK